MIEVLFTESAAGSMQLAKSAKNIIGSSTSVFICHADGSEPTAEELLRKRERVEEEYQNKRINAIEMEGTSEDVLCFQMSLSVGDVSDPFSDQRAEFLQSQVLIEGSAFADVGREMMETARRSLERVRTTAGPIRVWTSQHPDESCGFCHLMTLLPKNADIRVVELPGHEVLGSELRSYSGWADVDPFEFGRFQSLERPLSEAERRYAAGLWRELQRENGPLRAMVNGRLCTVGADFYDCFILRELQMQPREFHEGRLIGTILGKYPLGLSDSLVALRLEEFISRGMLTPLTEPEHDHPLYHRMLRKEC